MPEIILMGWDDTNKVPVRCKVTPEGKLIINPTGFLENPPTEDQDKKAPTSEWAYDHWKNTSAHHAKYTNAESRAAINNLLGSDGRLDKILYADWHTISRVVSFDLRWNAADTTELRVMASLNDGYMRVVATRDGVGYIAAKIKIYNGSAYNDVIDQGNFQAELDDYLENPPTQDVANKAPTSEWAYDHWKDAAAHHVKYTDKEATESFYSRFLELTTGTITNTDITNVNFILFNTGSGNITLKGLSGGSYGKMIFCLKNYNGNSVNVIHYSADAASGDKIATTDNTDQSIGANLRGAFWLVYYGGYWTVARSLP